MSEKKLVRDARVVTMDPAIGDLGRGSILIDGSRIVAVAADIEPPEDCEVIEAQGMIAIPGLVDAHKHLWQTALRGVCADLTLSDYFQGVRRSYISRYRPDDVRVGTYVGALELIDGGTTTVLDHSHGVVTPEHADALAEAEIASGIRGVWAYGYAPVDVDGEPGFHSHADRITDAYRVREEHFSGGGSLLKMGIATSEQGLLPFECTEAEVRSALDMDVVWTNHCHCPPGNAPITRGLYKLYERGLVDRRAVLSHCTDFGVHDFERMAEAGAHLVSTPDSELAFGIARPSPYLQALLAGVQPCLGTDCVAFMASDMFACMRMALIFARHQFNSGPGHTFTNVTQQVVTTRDVFRWATIEGARALGLADEIGSLTPGKAADVVLVDAAALNLAPVLDPVADLVLNAHAGNVDTVLINGVVRKSGGELQGVQKRKLLDDLQGSLDYLTAETPFVEAFKSSEGAAGATDWSAASA